MKQPKPTRDQEIAATIAEGCLSMRVRYLNRTLNAIYDDAYRDLGITASQGNMLVAIVVKGALSPTRLGQVLNIEKSTLSRNLDRMRKAGLIDILEPESGRSQTLRATRAGKRLLPDLLPRWENAQEAARELLGEQGSEDLKSTADRARKQLTPP
jgi:DNA-binding MarR family transcriptional regulator